MEIRWSDKERDLRLRCDTCLERNAIHSIGLVDNNKDPVEILNFCHKCWQEYKELIAMLP